jgi:4-amino-4-deoxy-L-arabinose transferase-like glycosyltransferase
MGTAKSANWLTGGLLALIVLVGAGVRCFGLDRRTISHPEIYVPGIDLPWEMSEPRPRFTLAEVIKVSIYGETHPPGYYMMMVPWTKALGTSPFVIRLPSVLFGVASIVLIYLLGRREAGSTVGLLASALLALNGHHVYWSQIARMYTLACFLGLLSTLLVLRIARGGPRPLVALHLYSLSTLAGLATVIFYWPIFLVQIFWVVCTNGRWSGMPGLLRWQLVLLMLASPLCAVAAYQSGDPSYAHGETLPFLGQFLEFGFLFEPDAWDSLGSAAAVATVGLDLVALLLLAAGLSVKSKAEGETASIPGPPGWLILLAAGLGAAVIVVYAHFGPSYAIRSKRILLPLLIPVGIPLLDVLMRRYWSHVQGRILSRWLVIPGGLASLSGLLAVLPITGILLVSQVVELFVSRGVMLFTPYFLITVSRGLVALVQRDRRWLGLGLVMVVAFPWSVYHYFERPASPRDYKALATELIPRVQDSDLVFVPGGDPELGRHWQTTPIYYYLQADHYHFVSKDYLIAVENQSPARIWVVIWHDSEMPPDEVSALRGYEPRERVTARGCRAVLYVRETVSR